MIYKIIHAIKTIYKDIDFVFNSQFTFRFLYVIYEIVLICIHN